jgi:hypothetical protein
MNTDEKDEYQNEINEMAKNVGQSLKDNFDKLSRAQELMELLEIPVRTVGLVSTIELYDIFMDDEKLKTLVSKLHNKAFW